MKSLQAVFWEGVSTGAAAPGAVPARGGGCSVPTAPRAGCVWGCWGWGAEPRQELGFGAD